MAQITAVQLRAMKERGERIAVLTAYDYTTARILDEAGLDVLLVGDSAGMVMLGHDSTLPVTMEDMLLFTSAVCRGASRALVVADLPFLSYQVSAEEAVRNAGRLLKEGGAQAVKLEGGREVAATVRRLVDASIPVMGHLGLTPQSVHALGGYKVQGRGEIASRRILEDAAMLEEAGAFSLVLECVPAELAAQVTEQLSIPTIGIGAGPDCDGQVLVFQDMAGLYDRMSPRFVKRFAELGQATRQAAMGYLEAVKKGEFPGPEHCFTDNKDQS